MQCLPLSPRSAKVAWRSLLPACHVAHLRCRLPCYQTASGSQRLQQRAPPKSAFLGFFVRMWGLNIYIYIQLISHCNYFLLLYVKLFLSLRSPRKIDRDDSLLKAEKWRPQSSQIAIFTFSHWAFSGFLSRNLCWVRDRRNAPAEKKASGRQASTKVSSLTTQHLSVSNRFTGCRARLMSIHDAKTLGEPSSSSSNTQRFKRNMFLSLVSYPYWYHILTWSNHHGTTAKKMKPIDGWNPDAIYQNLH